jgi:hypothetical protein
MSKDEKISELEKAIVAINKKLILLKKIQEKAIRTFKVKVGDGRILRKPCLQANIYDDLKQEEYNANKIEYKHTRIIEKISNLSPKEIDKIEKLTKQEGEKKNENSSSSDSSSEEQEQDKYLEWRNLHIKRMTSRVENQKCMKKLHYKKLKMDAMQMPVRESIAFSYLLKIKKAAEDFNDFLIFNNSHKRFRISSGSLTTIGPHDANLNPYQDKIYYDEIDLRKLDHLKIWQEKAKSYFDNGQYCHKWALNKIEDSRQVERQEQKYLGECWNPIDLGETLLDEPMSSIPEYKVTKFDMLGYITQDDYTERFKNYYIEQEKCEKELQRIIQEQRAKLIQRENEPKYKPTYGKLIY